MKIMHNGMRLILDGLYIYAKMMNLMYINQAIRAGSFFKSQDRNCVTYLTGGTGLGSKLRLRAYDCACNAL